MDLGGYMGFKMDSNLPVLGSPEIRAQQRRLMEGGTLCEAVDKVA